MRTSRTGSFLPALLRRRSNSNHLFEGGTAIGHCESEMRRRIRRATCPRAGRLCLTGDCLIFTEALPPSETRRSLKFIKGLTVRHSRTALEGGKPQ